MTTTKIASDNKRLRAKLLEKHEDEEEEWKDEKIVELEFLLKEYNNRNKALTARIENNVKTRTTSPIRAIY